MSNTVQILERYWTEHPAWFGRPYGEYLHLGANQEMLRVVLSGAEPPADAKVIDLSCALGGNARWLAAKYGCSVEGVDAFRPAIEAARKLAKTQALGELCRFQVAPTDALPFSDGVFDYAVTSEDEATWGEAARVLKPDGLLVGSAAAADGVAAFDAAVSAVGFFAEKLVDVTDYALAFYRAKEQEARLLVADNLMSEADLLALQMHTVDLYEAGGASHVLFRCRRS